MKTTRRIAKPIFFIAKKKGIVPPKPVMIDEPMDIVLIDDHSDDSIDEIELNIAGNNDQFKTPIDFWTFIDGLKWKDMAELPNPSYRNRWHRKENKNPPTGDFSMASWKSFKHHFWKYFNELKALFEEKGVFSSLERELNYFDQNKLLSHIIAKGQVYYATILSEPWFCGALVGKTTTQDDFDDFVKYLK